MPDRTPTPERAETELLRDGWRLTEDGERWTHDAAPAGESIRAGLVREHPAEALRHARRLVPSPRRIRE